jgi:hypothetical protein
MSSSYKQEKWTPFALNAMLVLLSGSDTAFRELCGISSSILCDEYRRNPKTVLTSSNYRYGIFKLFLFRMLHSMYYDIIIMHTVPENILRRWHLV